MFPVSWIQSSAHRERCRGGCRPDQDELRIEPKGNLAAMLGAAHPPSRAHRREARNGASAVALAEGGKCEEVARNGRPLAASVMVAGACNQRYLQLWSGAA